MVRSSSEQYGSRDQMHDEVPIEEQKKAAIQAPGKSWHDWFLNDFLRYSFWLMVLMESMFVISILSYVTGVSQFNPLLIGSTVVFLLVTEYYFIYRRIWGNRKWKDESDEFDLASNDIFDRIK